MKHIAQCLFLLLLLPAVGGFAQGGINSGEVDVVKSFEARLAEANRTPVSPELPALDTASRRLNYNIIPKNVRVEYLPPQIKPLAFRTDAPPEMYDGYFRLGGGLPGAFYGEFSYDISENEDFDFGINLLRYTANNGNKVENQRFSNNRFGLDGTYYFDEGFAVNGRVKYTSDGVNYYGYNDINTELGSTLYSFDVEKVRQRFNIFDLGATIFNGTRTQADFNYSAGVDLYLMNDNYATRENGFLLNIEGTKWFAEKHPLTIRLKTDFTAFRDTAKQNLNNFHLEPSYTYHADAFQVKLGFNLTSNDDNFNFFPNVEASANVLPGFLTAYVGAQGTLQKNNYRGLAEYNPFILPRFRLRNSSYNEYYGGIKGTISGITYQGQVGYKRINNLALFQLGDPFDSIPRFNVLYDTASIVTIKGTAVVPLFEGLEITGSVSQNIFTMENEEKPWHLPSFSVNAGARYTTNDKKMALRADFFLENGVPYRNSEGLADNLNALFDISLMAEYYFTENIGGWIQLNNLANNQRQRWFRYPTMGLNAMAGISARF